MTIKKLVLLAILFTFLAGGSAWAAKVDVNKADAATLAENLNGVGPVKAKAIVDYRKKHGSFRSLDDLLKVPGIGEGIIQKNRGNLSLKGGLSKSSGKKPSSSSAKKAAKDAKSAKAAKSSSAKDAKKAAKDKAAKAKKAKDDKAKKAKKAAKDKAKKAKQEKKASK